MKKKISVLLFVLLFVLLIMFYGKALAVPELKLPFPGGETYLVTQGNSSCQSPEECTHYIGGNLEYAWDFARSGCKGEPAVAPASGTVVYVYGDSGYNGGWGNTVIIDYGDESYGKLAHLDSVSVVENQTVAQGQQIGTIGETGETTGPHLHYQTQDEDGLNDPSIESSFSDVSENGGVPLKDEWYTSGNFYVSNLILTYIDGIRASWDETPNSDGYNVYLCSSHYNASQLNGDIDSFSVDEPCFCYDIDHDANPIIFVALIAYDSNNEGSPTIGYLLRANIYGTYNDGVAYTDARVDGQDLSWIGLYFGQTGVTHQQIDCASDFIVEIPDMKQRADLTDGPVIGRIDGYDLMAFCLHFGNRADGNEP